MIYFLVHVIHTHLLFKFVEFHYSIVGGKYKNYTGLYCSMSVCIIKIKTNDKIEVYIAFNVRYYRYLNILQCKS